MTKIQIVVKKTQNTTQSINHLIIQYKRYQLFRFKQVILKQLFLWPLVRMAGIYLNRVTASFFCNLLPLSNINNLWICAIVIVITEHKAKCCLTCRYLASGSGDTTVRFWDVNTETPHYTCKG